jgi:hypothetical protein
MISEELCDLMLPFMPQEAVNHCKNLIYTLGQSINYHFVLNIQLPDAFIEKGYMGPYGRFSKG